MSEHPTSAMSLRRTAVSSHRQQRCGLRLGVMLATLCCLWATAGRAKGRSAHLQPRAKVPGSFPITPLVKEQVRFWEKIFYQYPSTTTVIHDTDVPSYVIDIIDFKTWPQKKNMTAPLSQRTRQRITRAYMQRYQLALSRFQREGRKALQYGAIEKRMFAVYSRTPRGLAALYQGRANIRSQGGLADEFIVAAKRAQEYLPYMEAAFRREGVPVAVTRLAFVESMFNLGAQSKVGASGIWQFMPGTAKQFMRINHLVDERNSPFKATRGAAKLLAGNYRKLGAWPLAITAYNHGRAGMARAVRQVGSRNLDDIITSYRSPSFGYASRNFYSEFLAANHVYERLVSEKAVARQGASTALAAVTINAPVSVAQLLKAGPLGSRQLRYFNRCLRNIAFTKYRNHLLPANFQIFVPQNLAKKVRQALNRRGASRYASSR